MFKSTNYTVQEGQAPLLKPEESWRSPEGDLGLGLSVPEDEQPLEEDGHKGMCVKVGGDSYLNDADTGPHTNYSCGNHGWIHQLRWRT